ncbi:hypothetical protein [Amycolatopsis sp. lyj-112]|uniref:hypothetical protein n=1 Tax=Amycolatopsis sp. lyj-112 TaxID=2789288 RepID=UPI003978DA6F
MNLGEITTLRQLADELDQLRSTRGMSLRDLGKAAAKLPKQNGRQPTLPHSTASDLRNVKSVPQQETVVTWLAVCGVTEEAVQRPWLQALERVANFHQQRPPGAVRVRDARPRVLGVHASIQVDQLARCGPATSGRNELPLYVPRDFDADLRTRITLAGQQGGFVLVTGDSSVGKTRALFEAVRAVLPDWWLLHPGEADVLREFAGQPAGRTVVWLDELQDYLDFHGGVPAGVVRRLIEAGVVLVATCWPDKRTKRVALPADGEPDPDANDRRLLSLADVLTVPGTLSIHERRRAEDLAQTDRRIRVALDTPDAGFTQVIAAGPELIRHWDQAPAYAKAVITAALDARRVGAHAPLTRDYLEAAVPGYLTNRQQATPPPHWLDNALDYATELLHGATATLCPVAAGMGTIAGYQVADYLHQHALRVRRTEHLPDTAWHALICHHHPDDAHSIANNADLRGRDHEALTLYQRLIDNGYAFAAVQLVDLLGRQEAVERLRELADNGDEFAADTLAALLAKQGKVDHLCERADSGDAFAAARLAELLAEQGDVEQLRERADKGDWPAAALLAALLAEQGDVERLRERSDNGGWPAETLLAELLAEQGDVEQLRERADNGNGDGFAAMRLADLLAEQGDVEQLRERADSGDGSAAARLAELLAKQGDVERLRERADNGDRPAAMRLADLLAKQGDVERLRERADNDDWPAAELLADLLAKQGDMEQLRERADNGDRPAAALLADLRAKQGDVEQLRECADNGDGFAASRLADLLAAQGDVEQLRERADNGDGLAAIRLAELLAKQGMVEQLKQEVAAGTAGAADALRHAQSRVPTRDG